MISCYFLINKTKKKSYIGYTTNIVRRLRQHNGHIKGGAKYTKGDAWYLIAFFSGFCSKKEAMSFEWHAKRRIAANLLPSNLLYLKKSIHPRFLSWMQTVKRPPFVHKKHGDTSTLALHYNPTFIKLHDIALLDQAYNIGIFSDRLSSFI